MGEKSRLYLLVLGILIFFTIAAIAWDMYVWKQVQAKKMTADGGHQHPCLELHQLRSSNTTRG
jgi:hypothetical protein